MRTAAVLVFLLGGCSDCTSDPRETPDRRVERAPAETPATQTVVRPILAEATFSVIEGDVRIDKSERLRRRDVEEPADAGPPAAASVGDELSIGDAVVIGETGKAELRLPEQGRIELGSSSRSAVSPYAMNEIALVRGRMRVSLEAPGQGRRVLKVTMPGAYVLVQGTDLVLGAGDDGSARILAVAGPAVVRTASGKIDLAAGSALEVDSDGRAGRPVAAPPSADAVASVDGWAQGRRELVQRGLGPVVAKLALRIRTEVDEAPATLAKVSTRRDQNREMLKTLREKRRAAKGPPQAGDDATQRELARASEALIEDTDAARAVFGRVVGRFALARLLSPSGPPELDALSERVAALRVEAGRLFRRSPRRQRPDVRGIGPGPGLPGLGRGRHGGLERPIDEPPAESSRSSRGENH